MVLDYPQYPNGMYKLHKNDFDDIAREIMKAYMPGIVDAQQEVDINYLIKECLFLTVKSKNITADKSVLGLIAFEEATVSCYDLSFNPIKVDLQAGDILIDMSLSGNASLARRRFTLAHEASHWILHRSYHSPTNQKYEFRRPIKETLASDVERKIRRLETENDLEEWQANSLAAALLMPKISFIKTAIYEIERMYGYEQYPLTDDGTEEYAEVIQRIASVYNVSRQATEIRLEQLEMIAS
jgi:Zn-dependent peptidase ImmA (M78 family)